MNDIFEMLEEFEGMSKDQLEQWVRELEDKEAEA